MLNVLARDTYLNLLVLFLLILAILIKMVNPPTQDAKAEPPGNLIVHILWPVGDTDVDLWVDGPGELVPIGYSNKNGLLWNLLRDDLGNSPDATPINYEDAFSRGVVPGIYYINVHCYRCPQLPQVVDVEVAINTGEPGAKTPLKILVTTSVKLVTAGQERTAISFYLETDGSIRPGSMNSVFKPLRSANKSAAPSIPNF